MRFDICDREQPDLVISVEVDDLRPDQFKVTNDVAVQGIYDPLEKKMHGTKIYTKCPSKYEASEEENLEQQDGETMTPPKDANPPKEES